MTNYKGFYKIDCSGFGVNFDLLYNPDTNKYINIKTWDIEDKRIENDPLVQKIRSLPYSKYYLSIYRRNIGRIEEGSPVKVVAGRKYPKGLTGTATDFWTWCDRFGRPCTEYAKVKLDSGVVVSIALHNLTRTDAGEPPEVAEGLE